MGCLRRTLWPSAAAEVLVSTSDIENRPRGKCLIIKEVLRAHDFDHQSPWFINATHCDHADSNATSIDSVTEGKKVTNALDTRSSHDLFIWPHCFVLFHSVYGGWARRVGCYIEHSDKCVQMKAEEICD